MADVTQQLNQAFSAALAAAFGEDYAGADPMLGPANNPKFGDYQANLAMKLGKQLGKLPREIAQAVVDSLETGDLIEKAEIAGPGFINLHLSTQSLAAAAAAMFRDERLGVPTLDSPQTVVVDYSSPNVAKEMHVGHLRSTVIGDAIARVLAFQGHDVIRQNHLGDWGTQFGMLIENLIEQVDSEYGQGELDKLYKQSRKRFDSEPEFAERAKQRVVKLQAGDDETLGYWRNLVKLSAEYFSSIYGRLGVLLEPGDIRGESFYNDKLPDVIQRLKDGGALKISRGAGVVAIDGFNDKEGNPLPLIVQKSDGGYLYATTDLAAAVFRVDELHATRIIYVTGAPQKQHFEMFFATLRKHDWIGNEIRMDFVPFGQVLGEDGKIFRARSGESVRLVDLIDEAESRAIAVCKEKNPELTGEQAKHVGQVVGLGALKYADLSSDRIKDYKFSWERMLALEGNTAPYLINAYVRVHGIFRKGEIDFTSFDADHVQVQEPAEKALVLKLMQFSSTVDSIADSLEPHRMCNYLYELASAFHKFFESCPVLKSDVPEDVRQGRLALCKLVAMTLERGLGLLGIGVVERM